MLACNPAIPTTHNFPLAVPIIQSFTTVLGGPIWHLSNRVRFPDVRRANNVLTCSNHRTIYNPGFLFGT